MHIIFIILGILILICILFFILSYFIFQYIKANFAGYNRLIKLLKTIKGNYTNFMNFGYWTDDTRTLTEANKNLCDFIINKIDFTNINKILDIGCGYGAQDFYIFSKINKSILCLDIEEEQIKNFNKEIEKQKLSKHLKAVVGNATNLAFGDHSFDVILNIESAFHYHLRTDFFKEAYRILRPNGKLLITDILINKEAPFWTSYFPIKISTNFF